jgi:hypothetical protein
LTLRDIPNHSVAGADTPLQTHSPSQSALFGLAATLRDQGDLDGADAALADALEVSERAGIIGCSIEANSARALVHRMDGREEMAVQAAEAASQLAERVHQPVGDAATVEARGIAAGFPDCASDLEHARDAWAALRRPLDAARCELLRGERMLEHDPAAADAALARAEADFEALGVAHVAVRARALRAS